MTTYIPTDLTGKSTLIQNVKCVYGRDHVVHIRVDQEKKVEYIGCSCYKNKEEVEGMILLGADPLKTCLGQMKLFLSYITTNKDLEGTKFSSYKVSQTAPDFTSSLLYQVSPIIQSNIQGKQSRRNKLKSEILALQETESVVSRRLRAIMAREIGPCNRYFSIRQDDTDHYSFYTVGKETRKWDSVQSRNLIMPRPLAKIAERRKGVWYMDRWWQDRIEALEVGRGCPFCGLQGRYKHDDTASHMTKVKKAMFIALQSTSKAGLGIRRDRVLDKKGEELYKFTYRKKAKHLVGIEFNGQYQTD